MCCDGKKHNHVGKGIATVGIWGGVAGLCYMFHSFGLLNGLGAGIMVLMAVGLTASLWGLES